MNDNYISYKSIFILFLMIVTNYLSDVLPQSIRRDFSNSFILKHIFSFLVLFFFIIVVNPEKRVLSYFELLRTSLLIYFIFFLMCLSKGIYFIINLLICFILYIVHLKEDNIYLNSINNNINNNINNKNDIKQNLLKKYKKYNTAKRRRIIYIIKKILIISLYIILITGIIHNFYDKKLKFNNKFIFWKFIFSIN